MDLKEKAKYWIPVIKSEVEVMVHTMKEKGANRFVRPLAAGGIACLIAYQIMYVPATKKIKGLDRQIRAAEATAQYSDEYMGLREEIRALHGRLPPLKDKDTWLFDRVRETMMTQNLVSENLTPPQSAEGNGVAQQKMMLVLQLPFPQLIEFIQRLENIKPFVRVTAIDMAKEMSDEKLGRNQVTFEINTVVPVRRPG